MSQRLDILAVYDQMSPRLDILAVCGHMERCLDWSHSTQSALQIRCQTPVKTILLII